jgi:peptide/nickel transport system permease protein
MKLRDYVIRRLLLLIPVLLGVSVLLFALTRLAGDPSTLYITERMTDRQVEQIREKYGFNQPIWIQYEKWFVGAIGGDLGVSRSFGNRPVTEAIIQKFPATFELTVASLSIAIFIGIPLGVSSAKRRDRPVDHATRIFALAGVSIPIFWLGILLQFLFYYQLRWLPYGGRFDSTSADPIFYSVPIRTHFYTIDSLLALNGAAFFDAIMHLILPAIALSYASTAVITRLMRSSMLEVLGAEYIKTARAKGLSEKVVVRKHAVRNALIPTTTVIGLSFGGLLGGAILTETIFNWPGLGKWSADAILGADRAAILGFTLLAAVVYVVVNLIVDLMYAYLDPRIRLE